MPDAFDRIQGTDTAKGDAFDRFPVQEESGWKSAIRTAFQVPLGIAQATGPGIFTNLSNLLALGDVNDPEEMERIRQIAEREGIPFDEEAYKEAGQAALQSFPTPSNLARMAEEQTGAPLTPKTQLQNLVQLGATAGTATSGSLSQKAIASVAAPTASALSHAAGLPEPLADVVGLGIGAGVGTKAPSVTATAKKPSGLTTRRYEKLKEPTEVSKKKINKINEKVENEFRDIASDIIEKSPIEETHSALKNDVAFKQQAQESFKDVERIAEGLQEKTPSMTLKKEMADIIGKKRDSGISPSEYEKSHKKILSDYIKEISDKEMSPAQLVSQYRKNNKGLTEAYEPGQSFAHNKAKRDALQDYNRAIAEVIEKKFPDSEFSNLFKSTNKQWSQIMDAEAIDKFIDKLVDGKIDFKKGREFFDKQGMTQPFKRALGEKGFKDFQQLMKDLMSTEQASKMMKVAKQKGFKELGETAMAFVLHPSIGKVKIGVDVGKALYRSMWESLLDKPQLALKWDKGVQAFKKGNFSDAQKTFNELKQEANTSEDKKLEAFKKWQESKKKSVKKV